MALAAILISASSSQPIPDAKLDKNQEYVCVQWRGSADHTQRQPGVCLKWEIREKSFHRRV
jgi:hypothetical protein